jgi:hypothetical protein
VSAPLATFTYWDDDDPRLIAEHLSHWREHFPEHAVLTRKEARQLLERRAPQFLEVFDRIALPACRSDIARLLRLEAAGGLYVDAHCAIRDAEGIALQFERLETAALIVSTRHAPNFGRIMPHNSIVWCRPGAPIVSLLLEKALDNLAGKAEREMSNGFEPYHVWDLTGPGVFWRELFEVDASDGRLQAPLTPKIASIFYAENPVLRHQFTRYREPGDHWSERQAFERLFQSTDQVPAR